MPLSGLRVLDLSDHAGALCSRILGECGADVVRVEPPGGAPIRRLEPLRGGESLAHLYANHSKRSVVLDLASDAGLDALSTLARSADVIVDARSMAPALPVGSPDPLDAAPLGAVVLRVTPFGLTGPHAAWRGSDLICAARGGMVFVNGHPDEAPLAPFGLAAYTATGIVGAIAALVGLAARDRTGEGQIIDLSVEAATAGAVEHVTGLYRQTGLVQRRQGTLHWSRTFRIGAALDGLVLLTHLGDWTTLSEWVASECADARELTDPRWQDVAERKAHAESIFGGLDAWLATRSTREVCEGAQLRRLPFAEARRPETLAAEPQLAARGFVDVRRVGAETVALPGAPCRFSARSEGPGRLPAAPGADCEAVFQEWGHVGSAGRTPQGHSSDLPLDGVVVLDFTWVVAGPVATRTLADQGARVVKVERRNASDFGTRRSGLTGNLNRGKQSIVIDMETEAGRHLAQRLAAEADVVIDNFSARVMQGWGLDYDSLQRRRIDAIAVRLTGFGLDGPARDQVSYGPTLQALVGYPHLMRTEGGAAAGWGYSWSDMAAGLMGAFATLAALRHRNRTGEGQVVDLSQFENLVALLGPSVLDLLAGREVEAPANGSQEGARTPQGIYRCASDGADDDRWLALSIADDAMWGRLAAVLARDGEVWAVAQEWSELAQRQARRQEIDARLSGWTRRLRAEDAETRLQEAGVEAALVANGADLAADPQLAARGYFETAAAEGEEEHVFDGIPFLSGRSPGRVAAPGPLCGEHADSVLSELLGLGSAEIQKLRDQEVIG
ncbi:MAG: CoA transferase [Candidatus Binatia bacterium]|nr:CoA transferase [Candidatus Binatia bacterium]